MRLSEEKLLVDIKGTLYRVSMENFNSEKE